MDVTRICILIGVPMLLVSISNFKNDLTFLSRTGAMYTGFEKSILYFSNYMQGFRHLKTNKWNRNVFSRIVVTDSLIDLFATFFVASCRSFYCEIFTTTTILRRLNKPKRLIPAKMQIIHKI